MGKMMALATRYEVNAQVASFGVEESDPAMCGSETLTTVVSSTSINVLVITVMATIHGLTTGMLLFGFVALIGVIAFVAYGAFAVTSPLQSCHPEHRLLVRRILRFFSSTMLFLVPTQSPVISQNFLSFTRITDSSTPWAPLTSPAAEHAAGPVLFQSGSLSGFSAPPSHNCR